MIRISHRLASIIDMLPYGGQGRILEIGCGSGAAARELVRRLGAAYVLGIDRSFRAIEIARVASKIEIASGRLNFRQSNVEDFELYPGEQPFDWAFAIRVGTLETGDIRLGCRLQFAALALL